MAGSQSIMSVPVPKDQAASLIILNRDEERVATFGHKGAPIYEPRYTAGENVSVSLTFRVKPDTEDADHLAQRNLVVVEDPWNPGEWRLLEIVEADEVASQDGSPMIEVQCEESALVEMRGNWVEDIRLYDTDPEDALTRLLAASDTRWEAGNVSNTGTGSTNVYHTNAAEGIKKLLETWGGIMRFRVTVSGTQITGRFIDWGGVADFEDFTGVRWMRGVNLKSLHKTSISRDVYTAIYPYGKGGDNSTTEEDETGERKLTIADVEWSKEKGDPVDKPLGQTWIGDEDARLKWGYRNSSTGDISHIYMTQSFDDVEDPATLIQKGWDALQPYTQEWASYEAEIVDRSRENGRAHETTEPGTAGIVVDDSFNPPIEVRARVVEAETDLNNKQNLKLVLGSFMPSPFDGLNDLRRDLDQKVSIGAPITQLQNNIAQLADRLRSGVGYKDFSEALGDVWSSGPWGDPETTHYMQAKSGILAFANKWDPVAGEPDWTVGMSGDGINASAITTGTLNAELINIETVTEDGNNLIRMRDGYIQTFEDDFLTLKMGKYGLRFYDNGYAAEIPTNDWLGTIGYTFVGKQGDADGILSYRGVGVSTAKDVIDLMQVDSNNVHIKDGLLLHFAEDYARTELTKTYFGMNQVHIDANDYTQATDSSIKTSAIRIKADDETYMFFSKKKGKTSGGTDYYAPVYHWRGQYYDSGAWQYATLMEMFVGNDTRTVVLRTRKWDGSGEGTNWNYVAGTSALVPSDW